ncbi:MAG: sigma factor-like helix-turn-helix DNA-binding protein [Sphingopyxis granuli]
MSRYTRARRYLLRQYERAVDRIDETDRAIFLGHRVEELSYRQLAERHGISIAEVEEALIRSLRVIAHPVDRKNRRWWQFWRL